MTGITVIRKVFDEEVSCPPLAVPPLSLRNTVTVAMPLALVAEVNVKVPAGFIAG